jgi:predicted nicotinamide N-methyase
MTAVPLRQPIVDRTAFILTHTQLIPVPHAPEVRLHLADEATELWQKTEEELGELGLPPPFWAFAWAGGQALARYVLDNPAIIRGKRVLDFASGSGLAGIAAAKADASTVSASDVDVFACAAMELNAKANGVALEIVERNLIDLDGPWDVVLAGDICYERDLAATVTAWLERLAQRGVTVLIGDPGRAYLPRERLMALAAYEVPVTRALEDNEIKKTSVWAFAVA